MQPGPTQEGKMVIVRMDGRDIHLCAEPLLHLGDQRELVEFDLGVLERHITTSGLVRASITPNNGYSQHVWERDHALVMRGFRLCGKLDVAVRLAKAWLEVLHADYQLIDIVVSTGRPHDLCEESGKARVLQPLRALREDGTACHRIPPWWGTPQFDAPAYLLGEVCQLELAGREVLTEKDCGLIEQLIRYLSVMRCWEGDFGAWEQEYDIHASTLHALLAAFSLLNCLSRRSKRRQLRVPVELVESCETALGKLGDWHQPGRMSDMAHLLAFQTGRLGRESLFLLRRLMCHLWHWEGCIRHRDDNYMRSPGGEARWTVGSLLTAKAFLACGEYDMAMLLQNHVNATQRNSDLTLPEAYEYKDNRWVACNQSVLAWSHAIAAEVMREIRDLLSRQYLVCPKEGWLWLPPQPPATSLPAATAA